MYNLLTPNVVTFMPLTNFMILLTMSEK